MKRPSGRARAVFAHELPPLEANEVHYMPIDPLPDWQAVGARVALARRTLGLTQADLATRVELGRSVLAKVESGARHLSALELARLARETGLPIDWFVAPCT